MPKKVINDIFNQLNQYITANIVQKQHFLIKSRPRSSLSQDKAAQRIQDFWRLSNIKTKLNQAPYEAYVDMMSPSEKYWNISLLMLGQRQADFEHGLSTIKNPLVKKRLYHRTDIDLKDSAALFPNVYPIVSKDVLHILPLVPIETVSIDSIIKKYFSDKLTVLNLDKKSPFIFIHISKKAPHDLFYELAYAIKSLGLMASPWEISCAYPDRERENINSTKPMGQFVQAKIDAIERLHRLTKNVHAPTHKLAKALETMLEDINELSPSAYHRVRVIIYIMTLFYPYHYSKFAQHLYYVIHEISLSILDISDKHLLHNQFENYCASSKHTFMQAMDLSADDIEGHQVVVVPTLSGCHAHILGLQLAESMQVESKPLSIYSDTDLNYYEFKKFLTKKTSDDADVFCITTGPISYETTKFGIDVNRFVKNHLIDKNRKKPVTLLIDTTTTLYKNLKLNEATKAMIQSGQLSIIIHESHQKFGLLHTDQAQCGRMVAICSKKYFLLSHLCDLQIKAEIDYSQHPDLRVHAYINTHCNVVLEDIKQQHFNQGASLRRFLNEFALSSEKIDVGPDDLNNSDELYFCHDSDKKLIKFIPERHSFGHYITTMTGLRISADASDQIDLFLETTKLYFNYYESNRVQNKEEYYADLLSFLLEFGLRKTQLNLQEQVIVLTMTQQLINNKSNQLKNNLFFFILISTIIPLCNSLKQRPIYACIYAYYIQEKKSIRKLLDNSQWCIFLKLFRFLALQTINYDSSAYNFIGKKQLPHAIMAIEDILVNYYFLVPDGEDYINQCMQHFSDLNQNMIEDNLLRRRHLLAAINDNNNVLIKSLLDGFLSCDIFLNEDLITPLFALVEKNNSESIDELIIRNPSIYAPPNRYGQTPILLAAQLNLVSIFRALLDTAYLSQQQDSNNTLSCVDKNGWNALHWAAFNSDAYASRRLIQLNIPICCLTSENEHPVHLSNSSVSQLFEEYWVIRKMFQECFFDLAKTKILDSIFRHSYINSNGNAYIYARYSQLIDISFHHTNDKGNSFVVALSVSGLMRLVDYLSKIHAKELNDSKPDVSMVQRNSFFRELSNRVHNILFPDEAIKTSIVNHCSAVNV